MSPALSGGRGSFVIPTAERGPTDMDDEITDLTPHLCCAGCWSCTRLLELAYLRGWLEVSDPNDTLEICPSNPTSPPASA